jgi:hypothetical protein
LRRSIANTAKLSREIDSIVKPVRAIEEMVKPIRAIEKIVKPALEFQRLTSAKWVEDFVKPSRRFEELAVPLGGLDSIARDAALESQYALAFCPMVDQKLEAQVRTNESLEKVIEHLKEQNRISEAKFQEAQREARFGKRLNIAMFIVAVFCAVLALLSYGFPMSSTTPGVKATATPVTQVQPKLSLGAHVSTSIKR